MLVKQVMTTKVVTVKKDNSYKEVVAKLIRYKISGLPVVNDDYEVIGVISEKDLIKPIYPSQEEFYKDPNYFMDQSVLEKEAVKLKKLKANDFMSKDIVTVSPDDHILVACALLVVNNIRRLPVVENGKLVGIVTTNNLFRKYLRKVVK